MWWKSRLTRTSSTSCTASRLYLAVEKRSLGARTIDEGAMDEKSGMNFSEYMAILSGNTTCLTRRSWRRIASLEGERKSFNKGKRDSETKLQSKTAELATTKPLKGMTEDYGKFMAKPRKTRGFGNILNLITLDGVESTNLEVIGKASANVGGERDNWRTI